MVTVQNRLTRKQKKVLTRIIIALVLLVAVSVIDHIAEPAWYVQLVMYLDDVSGDFKISDEHVDWMWATPEKLKELELSSSLEKVLKKRNWEI